MRRKDREKDAAFALEVLRAAEYATLGTVNPDGSPYCVPISPAVMDGDIYFHCANEGKKLDNIKQNNSICLSAVRYTQLMPSLFTTEYESAVADGKAYIVTDDGEKYRALVAICEKYAGDYMEAAKERIAQSLGRTCVVKVVIDRITGKANT